MPAPYSEPGANYNPPRQLIHLALSHAANASVNAQANALQLFGASNGAPIVLTGVFQVLAQIVTPALKGSQKVLVIGSVSGDVAAGNSGQLEIELTDSASGALVTPVVQSYPADGTGVSANYALVFSPTLGSHTLRLQARATGDGTPTVASGHATIVLAILG